MPNKPDALVSDEFLDLRCEHGEPRSGSNKIARELQQYRATWDAAIAEARREGVLKGLELGMELVERVAHIAATERPIWADSPIPRAIRALKESL